MLSLDSSELYLCPTTCGLSDKGARPAGPVRRSRVAPLFFDDDMGKRNENRPRSYKYSFRLNEEQNLRFSQMLREAGSEKNRSRFIVRRLFGEPFTVVRRDPTKAEFMDHRNGSMLGRLYSANVFNALYGQSQQPTSPPAQRPEARSWQEHYPPAHPGRSILELFELQAYEERQQEQQQKKKKRRKRLF